MSIEQGARIEAIRRYGVVDESGHLDYEAVAYVDGYIAGASRPVTDAEVERAAVMFGGVRTMAWDVAEDWEKEHVLGQMRLALEAAREVGA